MRGRFIVLLRPTGAATFAVLCVACSAFLPEVGPSRGSLTDATVNVGIDGGNDVPVDASADVAVQAAVDAAMDSMPVAIPAEGGRTPDADAGADSAPDPDSGAVFDSAAVPDAGARMWTVLVGANGAHAFTPPMLTVAVGDTVRWVWQTSGHTVASGTGFMADGRFCSPSDTQCQNAPTSSAGDTYDHRFSIAGDFPYFCTQHDMMTGVIAVR